MDAIADRLVAKLRQVAPARVRVVNASDEAHEVAVPNRRKRWSQVSETIEARPWVRAELLDKHGAVLGFVDNDGPAGEPEELGMTVGGGRVGELRVLLELLLRGQREALSFRDKEHGALLQAMVEFTRVNMESTRELTILMREQREVAAETAAMRAAAVQKDDGQLDTEELIKLIKASPKLLAEIAPVLGPLIMRLLPAPPPIVTTPRPQAPTPPPSSPPAPAPTPPPSSPSSPSSKRRRGKP